MKVELIKNYEKQVVKLILVGNFCLTGVIDLVDEDTIVFTTSQKTSLIHISRIIGIEPSEGRK